MFVEAAARLHFGVLDLRGSLGRWFGGIGAAAPAPTLLVSACADDELIVEGVDAERVSTFANRFLAHHGVRGGARLVVHRALPAHAGLGSGTQLALAVARALAEIHAIPADAPSLARAVGRGARSAIGTWTFAGGGLVVDGGRRHGSDAVAPLVARLPFPPEWRCIVAIPDAAPMISGEAEEAAFGQLAPPSDHDVEHVAHVVLLGLLPALAEGDLTSFGAALSTIQSMNGRWFESIQGGTFVPGPTAELVRRMTEWGATGVGQSSWGPSVYGIVEGDEAARRVADRVRNELGSAGTVYEGPFRTDGASVWRAPIAREMTRS